ncbi:hypothetical protein GOP47_0002752 [Adiantum capillus-veneris]|uniref:Phosphatidic acid phosphatase type 2/haloperoxidase domain-containing protein n=1 Tax=Adiantum capillus-veneris TaxID=13818 RepID=A0A9D4VAX8_ADICA|nr:hypothetical protein GOP47_0002752 [Adiantum capillus-veneris]
MRSRSPSLPSARPEAPISSASPSPGKPESDNVTSMEDRGILQDIGEEVICTLRAASYKLFRFHLHDWLALIALAVIYGILNSVINPFYRYVGSPIIQDYKYPLKPNTIPGLAVPVIAIGIPLVIFIIYFLYMKDITDLHHAILGLLFTVVISAVITEAIKNALGWPRPNFFWRCFPDGIERYNNDTFEVQCTGEQSVIKEGHKSFPSGHTSGSFAGLGFLSLYLAGKLQMFDRRGHVAKLIIVVLPLIGALLVGLSRVDDYWHHWNDVFGGAILGLTMAILCYHHFFPSVFSDKSTGPHSYLQIGNNFKLSCCSWVPRRRQHSDRPPAGNGRCILFFVFAGQEMVVQ